VFRRDPSGTNAELYVSTRSSPASPWGTAALLTEINSSDDDVGPAFAPDGLTLWFSSARPGGEGALDIWMTSRPTRSASWSTPVNVTEVHSPENDTPPGIAADPLSLTLSRGPMPSDLVIATRASATAPWTAPVPMTDVNSPARRRKWAAHRFSRHRVRVQPRSRLRPVAGDARERDRGFHGDREDRRAELLGDGNQDFYEATR
jgi:hypothetical protein